MVRCQPAPISSFIPCVDCRQIEFVHHICYESRQMVLRQPILQRGWEQKRLIMTASAKAFVHKAILQNFSPRRDAFSFFTQSISDTLPVCPRQNVSPPERNAAFLMGYVSSVPARVCPRQSLARVCPRQSPSLPISHDKSASVQRSSRFRLSTVDNRAMHASSMGNRPRNLSPETRQGPDPSIETDQNSWALGDVSILIYPSVP